MMTQKEININCFIHTTIFDSKRPEIVLSRITRRNLAYPLSKEDKHCIEKEFSQRFFEWFNGSSEKSEEGVKKFMKDFRSYVPSSLRHFFPNLVRVGMKNRSLVFCWMMPVGLPGMEISVFGDDEKSV